jgi:hypothetical protein
MPSILSFIFVAKLPNFTGGRIQTDPLPKIDST